MVQEGTRIVPNAASALAVGLALKRLRFGVVNCSWLIACSLMIHLIIWSLIAMSDLHVPVTIRTQIAMEAELPLPTRASDTQMFDPLAPNAPIVTELPAAEVAKPAQPTHTTVIIRTKWDRLFELIWSMSGGFGKLAMLVMLPLVLAGVLLGAGSATPGIDRTVSAFAWSVALGVFVLPIGSALELPWGGGPFTSYDDMLQNHALFSIPNAALYMVMPLVCMAGCGVTAIRFSLGVEAGMPDPEHMFDPELEAEVGSIRATSLHGGRAAGALKTAFGETAPIVPNAPAPPAPAATTAKRMKDPQPGNAPRRLI